MWGKRLEGKGWASWGLIRGEGRLLVFSGLDLRRGYVSGLGLYPLLLPWASGYLPGGRRATGSRGSPGHWGAQAFVMLRP